MRRQPRFSLFSSRFAGFTRWRGREVQFALNVLLHVAPETHVLLASPLVRAFNHRFRLGLSVNSVFRPWSASLALPTTWPNMPMLTSALRSDCLATASVAETTQSRSPGVSSTAFFALPPDLRSAYLMDMGFAVSCPLARRSRLVSGSCPSTRAFAPRFLQTPPHDGSPCVIANPYLHQVG